jgi:hypothetical protein
MAYFDDMRAALAAYPVTDVELEIVDVDTPGDALNVDEISTFRVQVTNRGPLNLTGVTVRVRGQNGATVANNGAAAPFVSEFITQELLPINSHHSQLTVGSPLKFKAPGGAQASKTLVKATLEAWDANLDHILIGHSDPLDTHGEKKMPQSMRSYMFAIAAVSLAFLGMITPAAALQDWTTVSAACAGTDNNFFSGTPSAAFPVARFITPSGRLSFNGRHIGFIAVHCNVDNPRDQGTNPAWNQLEVTYIDPDGVFAPDLNFGQTHQVFVQLIQQNKSTGTLNVVAEFDSNGRIS